MRTLGLSDRLLALYGYGIEGCARRDPVQVAAVLRELLGLLDSSVGDATRAFHRLYAFCLARVEEERFDQVAFILRELHDASARAFDADACNDG